MCGITGIVMQRGRTVDTGVLRAATDCIRHRGPDDEGFLLAATGSGEAAAFGGVETDPRLGLPPLSSARVAGANLGLGFRRLSIVDLSISGHQPMRSADGNAWLIFNGEVYNHIELRRELEALGHRFQGSSDTEVVLASWLEWGSACCERFTGMWAMACYDGRADATGNRRLFLARDPFGIKPLFYSLAGGNFVFGSEIKQLLRMPWVSRRINTQAAYDFLHSSFTDHNNETLFADIRHFPPASSVEIIIEPGGALRFPASGGDCPLGSRRYWDIDPDAELDLDFPSAAKRVREAFLQNVSLHLRADVPVGSALSGGIDSSSIVAAIRHLSPDADLRAFSYIAHEDPRLSEEKWVDLMTGAVNIKTVKTRPQAGDLLKDIDALMDAQDEPFASTSQYAQFCVFRAAHEAGVKVMLDGQGADEILAGYSQYQYARLGSLLKGGRWVGAWKLARSVRPAGQSPLRPLWQAGKMVLPEGLRESLASCRRTAGMKSHAETAVDVLNVKFFRERNTEMHGALKTATAAGYRCRRTLRQELIKSVKTGLVRLLRTEDRNSMAHSIESRVPFLTTGFVSMVLSLPEEFLLSEGGTTKHVFRSAMRGITPDAILDRKDKIGFEPPGLKWMQALEPWITRQFDQVDPDVCRALNIDAIRRQTRSILDGKLDADGRLFCWLGFVAWQRKHEAHFA